MDRADHGLPGLCAHREYTQREAGFAVSREAWSAAGREALSAAGREAGSASGREAGSASGREVGFTVGCEAGSAVGREAWSASGREAGSAAGREAGSASGREAGSAAQPSGSLMGKVWDLHNRAANEPLNHPVCRDRHQLNRWLLAVSRRLDGEWFEVPGSGDH